MEVLEVSGVIVEGLRGIGEAVRGADGLWRVARVARWGISHGHGAARERGRGIGRSMNVDLIGDDGKSAAAREESFE